MATKLISSVALVFVAIFFTSSLEVYRGGKAESKAIERAKKSTALALDQLGLTSQSAVLTQLWDVKSSEFEDKYRAAYIPIAKDSRDNRIPLGYSVWHLSSTDKDISGRFATANNKYKKTPAHLAYVRFPKSIDKDTISRLNKVNNNYKKALALMAAAIRITKEDSCTTVFSSDGSIIYKRRSSNSIYDYSYDRLFLEGQRQTGHLSRREYQAGIGQLLHEYANRLPQSELSSDEQHFRLQLNTAEQQIAKLQDQVNSLEKHLAQAKRTSLEKWLPIVTAILTLLIALSANFIAWRTDQRQSREAELVPLKRQEIEQNIIKNGQEIRESNGKIVTPTSQELQLYSRAMLVDKFSREIRFKS